jgi:hypothetical protein
MAREQGTNRGTEHALLRSLRSDSWSAAELVALLGQIQLMVRFVAAIEQRFRPVWSRELPVSELVPAWSLDLEASIQSCREALGGVSEVRPLPATVTLLDAWRHVANGDPMLAFVVTVMGAHWGEPALRSALREALWHQPDLYNGDARFCWDAGGPEGDTRRRVWQSVMALGTAAARTSRLARSTRLQWYDGLAALREPPASHGTGPLVLASI